MVRLIHRARLRLHTVSRWRACTANRTDAICTNTANRFGLRTCENPGIFWLSKSHGAYSPHLRFVPSERPNATPAVSARNSVQRRVRRRHRPSPMPSPARPTLIQPGDIDQYCLAAICPHGITLRPKACV